MVAPMVPDGTDKESRVSKTGRAGGGVSVCSAARNMGIWVPVKTTIELTEELFRRCKKEALQEGLTLKQLFTEALESRLDSGRNGAVGKTTAPRWRRAYGALRHLRHERKKIERAIDSEFEKIEPEDRL